MSGHSPTAELSQYGVGEAAGYNFTVIMTDDISGDVHFKMVRQDLPRDSRRAGHLRT